MNNKHFPNIKLASEVSQLINKENYIHIYNYNKEIFERLYKNILDNNLCRTVEDYYCTSIEILEYCLNHKTFEELKQEIENKGFEVEVRHREIELPSKYKLSNWFVTLKCKK